MQSDKRSAHVENDPASVFVLDSFTLLAYLENAAGATIVQEKLPAAACNNAVIYMSAVSLGEVMHIIERERWLPAAQLALVQMRQLRISVLEATLTRILAAAHIKAHHVLSYADAFVMAAAQECQAILLTGDPEFTKVTAPIQIEWTSRT